MGNRNIAKSRCLKYFGDELAADVTVDKYLIRSKNDRGNFLETSPDEILARLRKEFRRIDDKYGDGSAEDLKYISFDYIVPQGSVLYGLGNNENISSISNCIVVASPEDNMSSIMDIAKELANLFKRRAGVGLDLSRLRPEGAIVNNSAGTSTGAWSFANLYSNITRMIGQHGRRGALMLTMDVRHPDIEKFITCKLDISKVTGANISIKISDEFMRAVETGKDFQLRFPVDSDNIIQTVSAKRIWNLITETNRASAEPGILFWDTILTNLPAEEYDQFKTICTNPCSEISLSAYDSCRLISLNLTKFVKSEFVNSWFDFEEFEKVSRIMTRLGDNLVDLEIEKLDHIISSTEKQDEKELWIKLRDNGSLGRRIGLGTHGLADTLAKMEIKYDSDSALQFAEKLYQSFRDSVYDESCTIARSRGAFPAFDFQKHLNNEFIKRLPAVIKEKIVKGIRNIALLTQAPTGSISILSKVSSGIEPVFANSYIRRKKKNHDSFVEETDFIDQSGDHWEEYKIYHSNVAQYLALNISGELPDYFVEAHEVDWRFRIKLQGIIQKFIDHSISSTINLPAGTSSEQISEIYLEAWKSGLKGITVYVDGSRTGVLIHSKESEFVQKSAPKRPKELFCEIHNITVKGEKYTFFVGMLNGYPYEVMGGRSEYIEISDKPLVAKIIKYHEASSSSRYDLLLDNTRIKNIATIFENKNNEVLTRMISLALRHGVSPSFLVEQLAKDPESDFFSFNRGISRVLKKYIKDGTIAADKICPECRFGGLRYVEGCITCSSCGFSKCS